MLVLLVRSACTFGAKRGGARPLLSGGAQGFTVDRPFYPTALLSTLATAALAIALLYFAKPVLAPLAVAALLSVVFANASARLERIGIGRFRLGRAGGALVLALGISAGFAGVAWIAGREGSTLVDELPQYRRKLLSKIREPIARLERTAEDVREIAEPEGDDAAPRVEVAEDGSELAALIRDWAGSAMSLLATAGVVIVLLAFLLIEREELRDRVLRLAGRSRLRVTGSTLREAADRVARYLRALTLLNCGHGLVVGAGLALLGVPLAPFFGMTSAILRFVPYLGPWIAACAPIGLSLAVFDGFTMAVWVALFLIAVELISNNVVEPWLYGSSVGLSPFAVVLSAVFWTWLWGPIGLVLATPLTVSLIVIGRNVPSLAPLGILLGDSQALLPHERIYERLIGGELDLPADLVAEQTRDQSPVDTWDRTLIPALRLLELDRVSRELDFDELSFAREAFESWIQALGAEPEAQRHAQGGVIVCVPAAEFADELLCAALARLLETRGLPARPLPRLLTSELIERVRSGGKLLCISALTRRGAPVRSLVRRLMRASPGLGVVVGFWGEPPGAVASLRASLPSEASVALATSLSEALALLAARGTTTGAPAEAGRGTAIAAR